MSTGLQNLGTPHVTVDEVAANAYGLKGITRLHQLFLGVQLF